MGRPKKTDVKKTGRPKTIIPDDRWIVSRAELIDLFQSTPDLHDKRFRSPTFPKEKVVLGSNRYNLKEYLWWIFHVLMANTSGEEMQKEKLRHEKYKADKAMYDAEERANQLLSRNVVVSGLSLLLSGVKNKLLAWIKRLPGLLANKSAREIEPILEHELYVILFDMSKGIKKLIPKEKKIEK